MPARFPLAAFRRSVLTTAPVQRCVLTVCATLALILAPGGAPAHAQTPPAAAARPAAEAVPVIVASSTEQADTVTLELPGSGLAQRSITLFPLVTGEVDRVLFRTGQAVTTGHLLVRLSDRAEQLAVELAAARLQTVSLLAQRLEATAGSGAVPEIEVEQAVAARRSAEIELAQARQTLSERSVRAPFSGVMGIAGIERGDRVSPTTALTTLDDRRQLMVAFSVAEAHLNRLRLGQTITATHPAYPNQPFTGRVSEIDSQIDPVLRTVRVRATVPNADDRLRTGMSFRVRLVFEGETRVSVPALALQFDREGAFVWAVREGKAQRVAARVVRRSGERVLVDSALVSGEPVVVEGVQRLRPGRAVRVVGERTGAASAS
jgi:membrane fusion protein (multidrug efflux system)